MIKSLDLLIRDTFSRFSGWRFDNFNCKTYFRHDICMLSLEDLSFLIQLNEFVYDKLLLEEEPVTYQCLEEWFDYKVRNKPIISFYKYCEIIKKHSTISNCP